MSNGPFTWKQLEDFASRDAKAAEMLRLCRKYDTTDFHLAKACEIYGKPKEQITKEERLEAKKQNYLFLYSGS